MEDCTTSTALVFAQSRLAPSAATSIPRLELCASVQLADAMQKTQRELDMTLNSIAFFSDSKIVLGYINNQTRRFHTYVANRVHKILSTTVSSQWHFIRGDLNPADIASRSHGLQELVSPKWLQGPEDIMMLLKSKGEHHCESREDDPEVRNVTVLNTKLEEMGFPIERFEKFSQWNGIVRGLSVLLRKIDMKRQKTSDKLERKRRAEDFIFKEVQSHYFQDELKSLRGTKASVKKASPIRRLDPFLDENGIIRVGGRLRRLDTPTREKHPVILPKEAHITKFIVEHIHGREKHQGRQYTLGSTRLSGYWPINGHSLVAKVIRNCKNCKITRGKTMIQKMSDLQSERVEDMVFSRTIHLKHLQLT